MQHTNHPNDGQDRRNGTEKRVPKACRNCRRSHKKCSRGEQCGRCVKYKLECIWEPIGQNNSGSSPVAYPLSQASPPMFEMTGQHQHSDIAGQITPHGSTAPVPPQWNSTFYTQRYPTNNNVSQRPPQISGTTNQYPQVDGRLAYHDPLLSALQQNLPPHVQSYSSDAHAYRYPAQMSVMTTQPSLLGSTSYVVDASGQEDHVENASNSSFTTFEYDGMDGRLNETSMGHIWPSMYEYY